MNIRGKVTSEDRNILLSDPRTTERPPSRIGNETIMEQRKGGLKYVYQRHYTHDIIDYFDAPPYRIVQYTDKNGNLTGTEKIASDFPTMEGFARSIGVPSSVLKRWAEEYPEFGAAYELAHDAQADILQVNSLSGMYKSSPSMFAMRNIMGWRNEPAESTKNVNITITGLMKSIEQYESGKDLLDD